MKKET